MPNTYPARFDHLDVHDMHVEDIPAPSPDDLACDWGNPQACQNDNNQRAAFAGEAVKAYAKRTGMLTGEDPETVVSDLLNDMRHLCDALGLDFEALAANDMHYHAELRGEF